MDRLSQIKSKILQINSKLILNFRSQHKALYSFLGETVKNTQKKIRRDQTGPDIFRTGRPGLNFLVKSEKMLQKTLSVEKMALDRLLNLWVLSLFCQSHFDFKRPTKGKTKLRRLFSTMIFLTSISPLRQNYCRNPSNHFPQKSQSILETKSGGNCDLCSFWKFR